MGEERSESGVATAASHALGWLVVGSGVGLWMSLLLLWPEWQVEPFSYGRWVPVHLNVQLYGWTALPLVAWLFMIYEVSESRVSGWAKAAVWGWTAALAMGVVAWLGGVTGGKIFLDWKSGALRGFVVAMVVLWAVLAFAWRERARGWSARKWWLTLGGLCVLAVVPVVIVMAASPATYPPVDESTGGPSGSSLLGSSLVVVVLMLMLPRVLPLEGRGRAGRWTWGYLVFCFGVFAVAEAVGGGHFDWWQNFSLFLMPAWGWLLWRDWSGFEWDRGSRPWRAWTFFWWGLLVCTGYLMYFPGVLDRVKFTQGLVAHSHLAMAGFTTSFCAVLLGQVAGRSLGGRFSVPLWHGAVLVMVVVLAATGWREGAAPGWMYETPEWRVEGMQVRAACGLVMTGCALGWLRTRTSL